MASKLLEQLLKAISDPTVVVLVPIMVAVYLATWRLFRQQHQFIKEKMDIIVADLTRVSEENELLRKIREELQAQLSELTAENQKLQVQVERLSNENLALKATSGGIVQTQKQLMSTTKLQEDLIRRYYQEASRANAKVMSRFESYSEHVSDLLDSSLSMSRRQFEALDRVVAAAERGEVTRAETLDLIKEFSETEKERYQRSMEMMERLDEISTRLGR